MPEESNAPNISRGKDGDAIGSREDAGPETLTQDRSETEDIRRFLGEKKLDAETIEPGTSLTGERPS